MPAVSLENTIEYNSPNLACSGTGLALALAQLVPLCS